jgi:hypothetical protein
VFSRLGFWSDVAMAGVGALLLPAGTSHATSAPTPKSSITTAPPFAAGYATLKGDEDPFGFAFDLPPQQAYSSSFGPVQLSRPNPGGTASPGLYFLDFQNLSDPQTGGILDGVVHVRAMGPDGACMANQLANVNDGSANGGVSIIVDCYDRNGALADRPFTVSYTRGGAQSGALITVQVDPRRAPVGGPAVQPTGQTSTVGGNVTVRQPAPGRYVFTLPALSGLSTLAVSPNGGQTSVALPASCTITSTALINNRLVKQVMVSCQSVGGPTPGRFRDTGVAITYARDVNVLGVGPNRISDAYLRIPRTTAPFTVVPPSQVHNQIFGAVGAPITVVRDGTGFYQLDLGDQQGGFAPESTLITANGGNAICRANASVTIPGNEQRAQTMIVKCSDAFGNPVDTGFELQYTTHQ